MQLKDNKTFKQAMVLVAVAAITGAIGVGLSAQMGPRRGPAGDGQQGPGMGPGGKGFGGPGKFGGPGTRGQRMRGGPGGPMGLLGFGLRGLDLTDDQHAQLRAVVEKHQEALKATATKVREARRGLHEAASADVPNEAAVTQKAAELGAAEGAAAVLRAKVRTEALGVLTPDQQQTLKERRSQMEQRMKEGRERMRQQVEPRSIIDEGDTGDSGPLTV